MPTKAQHSRHYAVLRRQMRQLRVNAGLTQRELGRLVRKPQSWVYNCETGNRRVDIAEFALWCLACKADPEVATERFLTDAGLTKSN